MVLRVSLAMLTAAEDLGTQCRSDAREAFCVTALSYYSNDLAGELALSVARIRQKQKTIKHNVTYSLPVTKELFRAYLGTV